jgi:hypothetical protein
MSPKFSGIADCILANQLSQKRPWAEIDAGRAGFYQHGLSFVDISRSDIKKAIRF